MHARKTIPVMIVLVMPLLLSGMLNWQPVEIASEVLSTQQRVSYLSYDTHGPIDINNDTHLQNVALAESWDGTGEEESPYIIEGYNITTDSDCIDFANVSLHFEIRDCYLKSVNPNNGIGVEFQNVSHGLIVDTFVLNKATGLYIVDSSFISIQNCTVQDCAADGIALYFGDNNLVDESTVSDCGSGIGIAESNFTSVMRSTIHGGMGGIRAHSCRNCTFEANTIFDNRLGFSQSGIYLYDTDYSSFVANEIFDNIQNGIYGEGCQHNLISENHIYNNSDHGIDIVLSENITILQNNIHDNGWWPFMPNELCGIYLGPSMDIHIEGNQIWNNTPAGITIESIFSTIIGNEIFDNTDVGIFGTGPGYIAVIENEIYGNGWYHTIPSDYSGGIFAGGPNWLIEDNSIWNNTRSGILSTGDANTIIGNSVWDSNNSGIYILECYDNIVTENLVYDNERGIDLVTIGTNVTSNIIYSNDIGIYADYIGYMCLYDNDIGWNNLNAFERAAEAETYWHDNDSLGNWWHDYSGTGPYGIQNETGIHNYDLYPQKNMYVIAADPIAYEISSTGNTMEFEAFALHPAAYRVYVNNTLFEFNNDWDGGSILLNVDGLSAGHNVIWCIVYHISGNSFSVYSYADITDETPPEWVITPTDQGVVVGNAFSLRVQANDTSGIGGYAVNDTVNFAISPDGVITNATTLAIGEYGLNVTAWDVFGNVVFQVITITVSPEPTTAPPIDPLLLAAIGGGAVIVILVAVVIMRRRPD